MSGGYQSIKTFPIDIKNSLYNSNKSYRLIQLTNGILTLLISNPVTNAAACGLCVASGSHLDPPQLPGLAHFCEHMLFLGSKEFPNPDEFVGLITSNGGNTNAFTTGEQTCFYYEIPVNSSEYNNELVFNYSLRNFSSFFKHPLFHYELSKREVSSINNEHDANKSNINKIFYHGLKLLANKGNPFSKFGTGNLFTLTEAPKIHKIDVRNNLINYFQTNYTPDKMSLVIEGPQSLNHLQRLAISNFNTIDLKFSSSRNSTSSYNSNTNNTPNHPLNILNDAYSSSYSHIPYAFGSENINKVLFIENHNNSIIQLVFPIKDSDEIENFDFYEYVWCNLLGDESQSSLCYYLRTTKTFISSIMVFTQRLTEHEKVLLIELELTKDGEKNIKSIMAIIFKYIADVITINRHQLIRYFIELQTIRSHAFYYQSSSTSIMDEVSHLSQLLQGDLNNLGIENFLQNYKTLDTSSENKPFWNKLINEFCKVTENLLAMNNFNLIVVSKQIQYLNSLVNTREVLQNIILEKDKFYHFKHFTISMNPLDLYKFTHLSNFPIFSIPTSNLFLSFKLSQLTKLLQELCTTDNELNYLFQTKPISINKHPRLLDYSHRFEIWHKREFDLVYKKQVTTSFQIQAIEMPSTALTHVAMELLCDLIGNELRYKLYPAELLGYSWGLYANLTGTPSICIHIRGPTRDFLSVLKYVISEFVNFLTIEVRQLEYKKLLKVRINLRKEYEELRVSNGIKQALAGAAMLLEKDVWSIEERVDALELIDQTTLNQICSQLISTVTYTRTFVNGDCDENYVTNIGKIINKLTKHEVLLLQCPNLKEPSSYLFSEGSDYIIEVTNPNNEDPLHTLYYHIQLGTRDDLECRTMGSLVSYILGSNLEYELRTKHQLGYALFSGLKISRASIGIYICIISGDHSPDKLKEEVEKYIFNWELVLQSLSSVDFQNKIISKFLESQNENLEDCGMPSNLVYAITPSINSSNFVSDTQSYRHHWNSFEKILSRTYRFSSLGGKEEIDLELIKSTTKEILINYYQKFISIKSHTRTTLSILIKSSMSENQIKHNMMESHLSSYLESKGVNLCKEDVINILETCN
ncbi:Metalloenzyme, LuxS/M16 peptidase-like protein, partial [Scheffersomyces amazonensis]|uniref:Metalloenzyme, LuxS/M16 peptidase-like protein n=1 Tax=Scheffersomyces amazonensis TaxID=1078765 RepID=UPI00315DCF9A